MLNFFSLLPCQRYIFSLFLGDHLKYHNYHFKESFINQYLCHFPDNARIKSIKNAFNSISLLNLCVIIVCIFIYIYRKPHNTLLFCPVYVHLLLPIHLIFPVSLIPLYISICLKNSLQCFYNASLLARASGKLLYFFLTFMRQFIQMQIYFLLAL